MEQVEDLQTAAAYVATRDVPLDELTPYPGNAKRGDVEQIRKSLRRNGQYRSLVVREIHNGPLIVLAGNHTLQALQEEGRETARCEIVTCDDATARRINLADNRTAELGTYDSDALAELLSPIADDLEGTGFAEVDLLELLGSQSAVEEGREEDAEDEPAAALPAEPVTQPGDVWELGPHRIVCGDCRDFHTVERLLDGQPINVAFTSPPYASQRAYDETSGFEPISPDEYVEWFEDVQVNVRAHLADDGSWFINIKEHTEDGRRHLYVKDLAIAHVRQWAWGLVDELIWYHGGTPGKFVGRFKNGFEPIFHFAMAPTNTIKHRPEQVAYASDNAFGYEPGRRKTATGNFGFHGADVERAPGMALPSNVLEIRNGRHVGDNAGTIGHEAAFTVRLPEWFIKAYSDECDTVFDPFMGSGSTLLAADRNQRIAFGTEISPGYCDVICRRYQQQTGVLPILAATGEAHDFLRE